MRNTPAETAPPRPLPPFRHDRVVADVLDARAATRDAPPQLGPSWAQLERAHVRGDIAALDYALLELIVAAMATLSRVRTVVPARDRPVRLRARSDQQIAEVLTLRAQHLTRQQIADRLWLSLSAVDHRIRTARRRGLLIPDARRSA